MSENGSETEEEGTKVEVQSSLVFAQAQKLHLKNYRAALETERKNPDSSSNLSKKMLQRAEEDAQAHVALVLTQVRKTELENNRLALENYRLVMELNRIHSGHCSGLADKLLRDLMKE